MFLTDRLANVTLGNFPLSRSWYTCWPSAVSAFWTFSFLASAVVFDRGLLNDFLPLALFPLLLARLLVHLFLDLGCLLLFVLQQLFVPGLLLLARKLRRESRYHGQVLAVYVHLSLDGLHAALLREEDAEPPQ